MQRSHFITFLGLIFIEAISRLIPHPPNFTALQAVALFSGCYISNRWLSFALFFSTFFLSDLVLGIHSTIPFVYISCGFILWLGTKLQHPFSLQRLACFSTITSLFFFLFTNFGVWMTTSLYPKTLTGLGICYVAGLPFLTNQLLGDLFYSFLLFSVFALILPKPSVSAIR